MQTFNVDLILKIGGIILGFFALAVAGFFAVIGWLDKKKKDRRKLEDVTEDRVISLLQTEVGELSKKVVTLEKREKELTTELHTVKGQNDQLIKIMQGRDDNTIMFQKKTLDAIAMSEETHKLVAQMAQSQNDFLNAVKNMLTK